MSDGQNLYAILGLPPSATADDIRSAYRSLARRLHPDANQHPGAGTQFREIGAAYEVLSDVGTRERYDSRRRMNGSDDKSYFTLRITPSKRSIPLLQEPQVLYLLAELVPEQTNGSEPVSVPLNIAVVVDHSLSMKGPRLERTKIAAFQLIEQLSERDILSVISFSDRAEVIVPAGKLTDRQGIRARVATMQAGGATEIFQGLDAAYKEVKRNASGNFINHIILITDGRTYGDELECLKLADTALADGIGLSAMGIGDEWNDVFLDQLASRTGGTSEYINSPNSVVRFLNERVKNLGTAFAERIGLSIAPDPDIRIESAFRLMPSPQPVDSTIDPIPVGQMQVSGRASVIFQLQLPPLQRIGHRTIARFDVSADVVRERKLGQKVFGDITIEVAEEPRSEEPPLVILDALGKLTLYRMQEKAEESLARGEVHEATRRLENLATRLLASGQEELANAAMAEARRVAQTNMLSEEGHKALKYGTRLLIAANSNGTNLQSSILNQQE